MAVTLTRRGANVPKLISDMSVIPRIWELEGACALAAEADSAVRCAAVTSRSGGR